MRPVRRPSSAPRASLPASALLTLALLALGAPRAVAIPLDWINAAGGFAGVAGNWNPAQVPTAADDLRFGLAGSYNVSFGANAPVSDALTGSDGTVQLSFLVPHTTNSVTLGTLPALAPSLRIASGSLTVGASVFVGTANNATPTLEVSGSSTDLAMPNSAGGLLVGRGTGVGTMSVINGGALTVAGFLDVPGTNGATGVLEVQGSGTSRRSTLTMPSNITTYYTEIGRKGTGTMNVQDGALVSMTRDLRVGETAGYTGTLALLGADTNDSARVALTGNLWIARNDVPAVAAGTGAVSIGAESAMDVSGATYTYDDDAGGLGTLAIEEGGRFSTHDLHVGNPATELLLHGGKLQVTGGTLDLTGDPLRYGSTTGTPTVQLLAGSTADVHAATAPALEVATNGAARLELLGGSSMIVHDKLARLGGNAGSNGTLVVLGGSTFATDLDLVVGRAGAGTLQIDGGSHADLGGLNLASLGSGSGTGSITGAGTDVHVTGNLVLSGLTSGSSGAASTLTVGDGARLWLDGVMAAGQGTVWSPGTLALTNGGELRMTDSTTLDVKGLLSLQNGLVTGGYVDLRDGGRITGSGDVNATLYDTLDTLAVVTATGSLSLGDATDPSGYVMRGRLNVGTHTVTLRDADSASVGAVSISGGTLQGPPGGIHIESGAYLIGAGTVKGKVRDSGAIYSTGTGLSFTGLVSSEGAVVQGNAIRFLSGGGFRGRGAVAAPLTVDPGATVTTTGALTLGPGNGQLVEIDGRLDASGQTVTFSSTLDTQVSGEIALGGGTLVKGTASLSLLGSGTLTGSGIVAGTLSVGGRVKPGPDLGLLTVSTLAMQPGGALEMELGPRLLASCDRVNVSGAATLGGTLDIRMAAGYDAVPGDSFLVLTCASRTGTFTAVTLVGYPATGKLDVHYNGTQVWVVIQNGLADVPGGPVAAAAPTVLAFAPLDSPGRAPAFELALPVASEVHVEVFDVTGRRVARLADGAYAAGRHRLALPSGSGEPGVLLARAEVRGADGARTLVARVVRLR